MCLIAKPKDTAIQFSTYAHTAVVPRMGDERGLPSVSIDLVLTGAEMLISIAKPIEKINERSKATNGENIMACVPNMAVYAPR